MHTLSLKWSLSFVFQNTILYAVLIVCQILVSLITLMIFDDSKNYESLDCFIHNTIISFLTRFKYSPKHAFLKYPSADVDFFFPGSWPSVYLSIGTSVSEKHT